MSDARERFVVLFSGFNPRAVLATARTLRARGVPFVVVARERDGIVRTRHRDRVVATIGRTLDLSQVVGILQGQAHLRGATPVVLPMTEFLNRWLLDHRAELEAAGAEVPMGSTDGYLALSDKGSFERLCQQHDLPTPRLHDSLRDATLPFAAKPVTELDARGRQRTSVIVRTEQQRRTLLEGDDEPWLVQHFIEGQSRYVLLHRAADGTVVVDRQRNGAQQGNGGSVVWAWRTDAFDIDLERRLGDLLAAVGHVGLAMFEVKVEDGRPHLIECNPRPWGPLQLVVDVASPVIDAWLAAAVDAPPAPRRRRRAPGGRSYVWIGGMVAARRDGRGTTWFELDRPRWRLWLDVRQDVHLRRDSWRLFLDQFRP